MHVLRAMVSGVVVRLRCVIGASVRPTCEHSRVFFVSDELAYRVSSVSRVSVLTLSKATMLRRMQGWFCLDNAYT